MKTLPWYQSKIIQQQVAQLIIAGLTLTGVVTDIDWNTTVAGVFAGIAALVAVWTVATRMFKASPPITETSVKAEEQFQEEPQR